VAAKGHATPILTTPLAEGTVWLQESVPHTVPLTFGIPLCLLEAKAPRFSCDVL
jgi:hypothetical protein